MMDILKRKGAFIAAIMGGMAVLLYLFLPALKAGDEGMNGWRLMTATGEIDGGEFVFMMLFTVLAMLAGAVTAYLSNSRADNLFKYVSAACFIVSGFFCLMTKYFFCVANGRNPFVITYMKLDVGAIAGILLSFASAGAVLMENRFEE